ncbi:MAG: L-threonylcarbamoyladenylate synthase [Anaerolineae bacterium]|nr:L-threonylcarbamoyladenylate synthase [Anaerolineae bacterium]
MKTVYLKASDEQAIKTAAAFLKQGQLVVFATDTLYGVAAAVDDAAAIDALYRAKGRPDQKGIPVLLSDASALVQVARDVPDLARELSARFWPGPLTLILPRRHELPANLSADENVAVRMPENAVACAIIREAGGAVAATSANRSGEPPARNAEEAMKALGGLVAAIVDGGEVTHGIASTIVDCTASPPVILRHGPLTADDLALPA